MDANFLLLTLSISICIAYLSLNLLERPDFDCPGDTISYNCSILSNSENITLEWSLVKSNFDQDLIFSEFDAGSTLNEPRSSGPAISFILTEYVVDEYIESILDFTVGTNSTIYIINLTLITCGISDLATASVDLIVNLAGM